MATPRVFLSWNTHPASHASPSRRRVGCNRSSQLRQLKATKHNISKLFYHPIDKKPKQKPNNPDRKYTQSYSSLVHEFKQSVMKIKIMFRNSFLQILRWFLSYCYKHIFPRPVQFIIIVRSIYFSTN